MDLTAAFAFLDSDSEDDEAPTPPFPALCRSRFLLEDDRDNDNMMLLFGMAACYSAGIQSGVRECDRSKIDEWCDDLMEGEHDNFRRGMRLEQFRSSAMSTGSHCILG